MKAVCGLDVHKDSIYLRILHPDGELFDRVSSSMCKRIRDAALSMFFFSLPLLRE